MQEKSKKILLIMPLSYKYYDDIMIIMRKNGYDVDFVPDFNESFFYKSVRYISKSLSRYFQNKYILNKILPYKFNNYDLVFVIRGYSFTRNTIVKLKSYFSSSKFILYQWDPLTISKFDRTALELFDKYYTFDYNDAITYFNGNSLPLFYSSKNNMTVKHPDIDISFVGTGHSNRLHILSHIITQLQTIQLNFLIKIYINRYSYYLRKILFTKGYNSFPRKYISFKPIPREIVQNIFDRSKIIIDIHHPSQNGLSIRVIEVLSKNKKLITTNFNISKEHFYDDKIIKVIKNNHLEIDNSFLNSNITIDISHLEINNWLKYILEI